MPLAADTMVGVVGAGAMGSGIAQVAAVHGHRVMLSDADAASLDRAKASIGQALDRQVEKGKLTAADARDAKGRITYVAGVGETQWASFAGCGLVIEAILEELTLKKAVFTALERVRPGGRRARHQHVVAVRGRDRRGVQASGPRRGHPLLQSRAGDAAGRDRAARSRPTPAW